jgi:hypothetical protein
MLVLIVCADSRAIEQVETLLKTQDTTDSSKEAPRQDSASAYVANTINQPLPNSTDVPNATAGSQAGAGGLRIPGASPFQNVGTSRNGAEPEPSWEMIGLGLEEPLPPQEIMDDLYEEIPACSSVASLTLGQISNIFLQDLPHTTHHTQTTIPRRSEPGSSYAPASLPAIHHVDPGRVHYRQVRSATRTLLSTCQEICAHG